MLRTGGLMIIAVIVPLTLLLAGSSIGDPTPLTGLAGARPAIDAGRFPSLQAALDALPSAGGLVLLPAGEFLIEQPLRVRSADVCIQGSGTATHIKNVNANSEPALVIEHPNGARARDFELWRICLSNFRITGNEQSGHGIVARSVNELLIDRVSVSYHGGDGILLDHCYEDPRICNSLITYNKGTGLNLLGCHDIVVSATQFEENQDALHCFDGFNLCMSGNCLDDHLRHGVVIENTYGSVISGNMIEECNGAAIILDRDCYGIAVSANVIAHNGEGIDLRNAHGCSVSANTLTIMKENAVRVGPKSGRIAINGNAFSNSFIGDRRQKRAANDRDAAGLVLDGTSDVGISGNVFTGVGPKAIATVGEANRRILVAGNILANTTSDHTRLSESIVAGNLDPE